MKKLLLATSGLVFVAAMCGSAARAETVISVSEVSYDARLRPVCTAIRMDVANYSPANFDTATDACALIATVTSPYGADRITRTVYNGAGQVIEVKRAVGTDDEQIYATFGYTKNGLKAYEADANGNLTRLTYDGFDRLHKRFYPSDSTTRTAQPCGVTPEAFPGPNVCGTFQPYSLRAGDNDSAKHPLLGAWNASDYEEFGYDISGNRTMYIRRDRAMGDGYQYDKLNRQVYRSGSINGSGAITTQSRYDLQGRLIYASIAIASGTAKDITNTYDALGRLVEAKDVNNRTIYYQYDQASRRTLLTYPGGVQQAYEYNTGGLLKWTGLADESVKLAMGYDPRGRLTSLSRTNGAVTTLAYDDFNRATLLKQDVAGTSKDIEWTFASSNPADPSWRNPAGQVIKWNASNPIYDYVELTTRLQDPTFNGLNQDMTVKAPTQSAPNGGYDLNGNLINNDPNRAFTYDIDNRLTGISGLVSGTLEYDPLGRLSKTVIGGQTRTYLYDGVNLIAEYDATSVKARYMHTLGVDQPWVQFTTDVLPINAKYLVTNYQGSIIALSDSSGEVDDDFVFKYGPWGEPKNLNGATTWSGSRFMYTGQTAIPEAQLYYYKARVYDPNWGRFLQTDPIGSKDDLDLYAYVRGDPINSVDPTGLKEKRTASDELADGLKKVAETYVDLAKFYVGMGQGAVEGVASDANSGLQSADNIASGRGTLNDVANVSIAGSNIAAAVLTEGGSSAARRMGLGAGVTATEAVVGQRIGVLREAMSGAKLGNVSFPGGPLSAGQAHELGVSFVGPNATLISGGKGLVSADNLRVYRFPVAKSYGGTVANLEARTKVTEKYTSNIHVNVQ